MHGHKKQSGQSGFGQTSFDVLPFKAAHMQTTNDQVKQLLITSAWQSSSAVVLWDEQLHA